MANIYDIVGAIKNLGVSEEEAYAEQKEAEAGTKEWKGELKSRYIKKAKDIATEAQKKAQKEKDKFGGLGKAWDIASFFIPGGWALKGLLGGVVKGYETKNYIEDLQKSLSTTGGLGKEFEGTVLDDHAKGFDSAQKEQLASLDPNKAALAAMGTSFVSSGVGHGVAKGLGDSLGGIVDAQKIAKTEAYLEANPELAQKFVVAEEFMQGLSEVDLAKLEIDKGVLKGLDKVVDKSTLPEAQMDIVGISGKDAKFETTSLDFDLKGKELKAFLEYQEAKGFDMPSSKNISGNLLKKTELPENWKESMTDRKVFGKDAWTGGKYTDTGESFGEAWDMDKPFGGLPRTLASRLKVGLKAPFKKEALKDMFTGGIEGADLGLLQPFYQQKQGTHWTDLAAPEPHEWFKNVVGFEQNLPKI